MEPDSSLHYPIRDSDITDRLRTNSTAMRACLDLIGHAARARVPVMLVGESGVGKSLLTGYLHRRSERAARPVALLRCAELRPDGVKRRLLGDKAGPEPGGAVGLAAGGTLVLDGVEQMDNAVQQELVEVLSAFSRADRDRRTAGFGARLGVRLVSIRTVPDSVGAGLFVDELLYGLGEVIVRVPPLRHRREDIDALSAFALRLASGQSGRQASGISSSVREFFHHYGFPGNVRELFRMLTEAAGCADGDRIYLEDLEGIVGAETPADATVDAGLAPLAEMERRHIYKALLRTGWRRSAAARILGVTETLLTRKIKLYGLERR